MSRWTTLVPPAALVALAVAWVTHPEGAFGVTALVSWSGVNGPVPEICLKYWAENSRYACTWAPVSTMPSSVLS